MCSAMCPAAQHKAQLVLTKALSAKLATASPEFSTWDTLGTLHYTSFQHLLSSRLGHQRWVKGQHGKVVGLQPEMPDPQPELEAGKWL